MKRYFLATAAVLGLSAGSALAAGPDATTTTVAPTAQPLGVISTLDVAAALAWGEA